MFLHNSSEQRNFTTITVCLILSENGRTKNVGNKYNLLLINNDDLILRQNTNFNILADEEIRKLLGKYYRVPTRIKRPNRQGPGAPKKVIAPKKVHKK